MAENVKALRRRVKSIKNTSKITRAMEMVSAAKLRRTQQTMQSAKPFTRKLEEVLGRLAQSDDAKSNPFFERRTEGGRLLVLVTADRGLCGGFNANILKIARRQLLDDPQLKVFAVGRKGRDFTAKYFKGRLVGEAIDFAGNLNAKRSEEIGAMLLEAWASRAYAQIDILSSEFISSVTTRPRVSRFLPVTADSFAAPGKEKGGSTDFILEPSPERVFEALLPRYLKAKIYLTLAETLTCEHSARMLAMNAATKNCNELVGLLTLKANKMRQAQITTEIVEIVSGAEALKG